MSIAALVSLTRDCQFLESIFFSSAERCRSANNNNNDDFRVVCFGKLNPATARQEGRTCVRRFPSLASRTLPGDRMREGCSHAGAIRDGHQDTVDPPPADKDPHRPGVRQTRQGHLQQHAVRVQYAVLELREQVQAVRRRLVASRAHVRAYVLQIEQREQVESPAAQQQGAKQRYPRVLSGTSAKRIKEDHDYSGGIASEDLASPKFINHVVSRATYEPMKIPKRIKFPPPPVCKYLIIFFFLKKKK